MFACTDGHHDLSGKWCCFCCCFCWFCVSCRCCPPKTVCSRVCLTLSHFVQITNDSPKEKSGWKRVTRKFLLVNQQVTIWHAHSQIVTNDHFCSCCCKPANWRLITKSWWGVCEAERPLKKIWPPPPREEGSSKCKVGSYYTAASIQRSTGNDCQPSQRP